MLYIAYCMLLPAKKDNAKSLKNCYLCSPLIQRPQFIFSFIGEIKTRSVNMVNGRIYSLYNKALANICMSTKLSKRLDRMSWNLLREPMGARRPGSNKNKKNRHFFLQKSNFFSNSKKVINKKIACLSVCLYVSFKRKNGWTDRFWLLKSANAIFVQGFRKRGEGREYACPGPFPRSAESFRYQG